tara:strand:- start:2001 stop:2408 length:408 start_codon:yes stop_codon:yes gene_type:complete
MAKAPTKISYKKLKNALEIKWEESVYSLPIELLRVCSPSADARGRHGQKRKPQSGKKDVRIENINQTGNYGIRLTFDDGHDTGIFVWEYLYDLAKNQEKYWREYLKELEDINESRLPRLEVKHWNPQNHERRSKR